MAGTSPKIAILIGSVRKGSNTARTARLVAAALVAAGGEADLIDPREMDLSLPGLAPDDRVEKDLQGRIRAASGVILVTPEYDGSYSSVMKLLIEHLGYPSVLAGKPVHLVGVASGRIGAVKALEHLRSVCGSVGSLVLPQSPSIEGIHTVFDDQGRCTDPQVEALIHAVATTMLDHLQSSN